MKLTTRERGDALTGVPTRSRANDFGVLSGRGADRGVDGAEAFGGGELGAGDVAGGACRAGLAGDASSDVVFGDDGSSCSGNGASGDFDGDPAGSGMGCCTSSTTLDSTVAGKDVDASASLPTPSDLSTDLEGDATALIDLREALFCTAGED